MGGGQAEATSWSGAATKHLLWLSSLGHRVDTPPTNAFVGHTASPIWGHLQGRHGTPSSRREQGHCWGLPISPS